MVLKLLGEKEANCRPFDLFHIFVSLFLYLFAPDSNLSLRVADFWQFGFGIERVYSSVAGLGRMFRLRCGGGLGFGAGAGFCV